MPDGRVLPGAAAYDDVLNRFEWRMGECGFSGPDARAAQATIDLALAATHGFADKTRFAQSLVETYHTLMIRERRPVPGLADEVYAIGMSVFTDYPYAPLPGAVDVLNAFGPEWFHLVVTKGDVVEQTKKLADSGLGDLVDAVEVVGRKDLGDWLAVLGQHDVAFGDTAVSWAVGNSLKADVNIPLALGFHGIWIDGKNGWAFETAAPAAPAPDRQFHRVTDVTDVLAIIPR